MSRGEMYSLAEYVECIRKLKMPYPSKNILFVLTKLKDVAGEKWHPTSMMYDGRYHLENRYVSGPTATKKEIAEMIDGLIEHQPKSGILASIVSSTKNAL